MSRDGGVKGPLVSSAFVPTPPAFWAWGRSEYTPSNTHQKSRFTIGNLQTRRHSDGRNPEPTGHTLAT